MSESSAYFRISESDVTLPADLFEPPILQHTEELVFAFLRKQPIYYWHGVGANIHLQLEEDEWPEMVEVYRSTPDLFSVQRPDLDFGFILEPYKLADGTPRIKLHYKQQGGYFSITEDEYNNYLPAFLRIAGDGKVVGVTYEDTDAALAELRATLQSGDDEEEHS